MAREPKPASHLKGGYLLRNPLLWSYLRVTDDLLRVSVGVAAHRRGALSREEPPQRVLLAIGGQLGDAVAATSIVDIVREALPSADIGVALPSWARVVLEGDRRVRWLHSVDHWRPNRRKASLVARVNDYRVTWHAALESIRAIGYDAAFDLYPYYPNMAGLLWRAGIRDRFGFTTGGRGALYTRTIDWVDDRSHIAEKQARLIRLAMPWASGATPIARIERPTEVALQNARELLQAHDIVGEFVVLHPGSGSRAKEWPIDRWQALAAQLNEHTQIVVTGAGDAEREAASAIVANLSRAANLVGTLDWRMLSAVVASASVVASVDTSVAHLAAALRVPVVVVHAGVNDMREWRPLNAPDVSLTLLSERTPCAPCYRPNGCEAMTCIRDVSVAAVAAAVLATSASERHQIV